MYYDAPLYRNIRNYTEIYSLKYDNNTMINYPLQAHSESPPGPTQVLANFLPPVGQGNPQPQSRWLPALITTAMVRMVVVMMIMIIRRIVSIEARGRTAWESIPKWLLYAHPWLPCHGPHVELSRWPLWTSGPAVDPPCSLSQGSGRGGAHSSCYSLVCH